MAQTISADIDRDLLAALDARAGLLTLHAILLRYKASGVTAEQVESLLQELRGATHDEALEDAILDALDMVTGWCAPQLRVWG
jgi:pantothenate kinase-related protein Tda10